MAKNVAAKFPLDLELQFMVMYGTVNFTSKFFVKHSVSVPLTVLQSVDDSSIFLGENLLRKWRQKLFWLKTSE